MKKTSLLCLVLSTLLISFASAQQMSLQLNKDDQTILDPVSGDIYSLDESTKENNLECQPLLQSTSSYFFVNGKEKIINAETCFEYIKKSTDGEVIGTGNTTNDTTTTTTSGDNQSETTTGNEETDNTTENSAENEENNEENSENENTNEQTEKSTTRYQNDPELSEYENAVAWLYQNGATIFSSTETFGGDVLFTREQGAKIVLQVARIVGYKPQTNLTCDFKDINEASDGLVERVKESCEYGIFKGSNGNFYPKQPFNYAQVLTVITKILQDGKVGADTDPWWQQFYDKTNSLGFLEGRNITEENIYDATSREQAAILLYRLRNFMLSTTTLNNDGSEKVDKDVIINTTNFANQPLSFENDPEFLTALSFMFDNGMTSKSNPTEFRPLNYIQRQQRAKFTATFHQKFFGAKYDGIPDLCFYDDLSDAELYARSDILYICKEKLFDTQSTAFSPTMFVTHAEFITSIIKMLDIEVPPASGVDMPSWEPYYQKAFELGIVTNTDKIKFPEPITRFEAALHYYRIFVRYKFLENYEQDTSNINNVITIFDDSNAEEILDNTKQKKIAINTEKLFEQDGRIGVLEMLDGKKYMLQKDKSINIYTKSNNWFGTLYTIDTDEKAGTVNFLMNIDTRAIIHSTVRMNDGTIYEITPSKYTSAYYIMTLKHNADQAD